MGKSKGSNKTDLIALRFLSVNSIIDPWVFIFLSPSVLRFLGGALCKTSFIPSRDSLFKTSISKNQQGQIELHQPTSTSVEKHTPQQVNRSDDLTWWGQYLWTGRIHLNTNKLWKTRLWLSSLIAFSIYLSIIYLSIYRSIYHLSIYLSYLSIYLSFIYHSIYVSI